MASSELKADCLALLAGIGDPSVFTNWVRWHEFLATFDPVRLAECADYISRAVLAFNDSPLAGPGVTG